MSTKPQKGRPLPSGGRVGAARSGPRFSLFAIIVGALVAVVIGGFVVVALIGWIAKDDEPTSSTSANGDDTETVETQAFGPVTVEGQPLVAPPEEGDDPAVGEVAPTLIGETPTGEPITITPGGGPMVVAFVAHWCPHCQAEVPRIVDLMDEDGMVDGVKVVAVVTGSDEKADNWPPDEWLDREGWAAPVMVDSKEQEALQAYGPSGYPYLVALDADGKVVARASGEQGEDKLPAFFAQAKA